MDRRARGAAVRSNAKMRLRETLTALSTERLMTLVLLLCLFVMAARPIVDPDFWWHLRTGQHIFETGTIPRQDVFSHTLQGQPWITHEWLTEVILYAVYAIFGQGGLILVFAGIITAAFALSYLQCDGRPYLASFVVLLAAIASAVTWGVRPQMLSLLLSAVFLYILHLSGKGNSKYLWLLPPLMVLWANLHGSFFLGLVYLAARILGATLDNVLARSQQSLLTWKDIRRLTGVTLVTAAAPILNPNGIRLLIYPFGTLGSPAMQQYIMEWFSPDFHLAQFQPFALYVLILITILGLSRSRPTTTDFIFMLGFGYASLRSARLIPFFVLTTTPMLARQLPHVWRDWGLPSLSITRRRTRGRAYLVANWVLLAVLILGGAALAGRALLGNAAAQRDAFPVAAVDFLEESETSGNIYNLYHWGGYLIWRLYPERKVFIDGRADVYGDAFIDEYLQVYQLREAWQEPLDRYDVSVVIIDKGSPLSTMLSERSEWLRAYADEQAVIFTRQEGR
jgi:hypothetical protein